MRSTTPTALLVDDEPSVLSGISRSLCDQSLRILTASSARMALDVLESEPVEVVISDERMPGMSGTEFLAEVRRRFPDIVRIVLSGSGNPREIARAINDAGVFRYLNKPCSGEDLILAVTQGLQAYAMNVGRQTEPRDLTVPAASVFDSMQMHHQPIFEACGPLYAHEALLRLPQGIASSPMGLLQAAECEGCLWELEHRVRKLVSEVVTAKPKCSQLFVNLHPGSLLDPFLYSSLDPLSAWSREIVLEITERSSLARITDLPERIERLRGMGYRIAIDDLGTGYSGLTTFARIIPDVVKFDRELVQGVQDSPAKRRVVESMVEVCRDLGIFTIAEGIETREELDAILEIGCDGLQGFLLGRPQQGFWSSGAVWSARPRSEPADTP